MASTNMDSKMDSTSESDMLGAQSDSEYSTAPGAVFRPTSLDYWYGGKYFEEIIARELFDTVRHDYSMSAIDARLRTLIRTFPYANAIQSLQTENPRLFRADPFTAESDGYDTLVRIIGVATRHGTIQDKDVLSTTIIECLTHQGVGTTRSPPPRRSVSPVPTVQANPRNRTSPPIRDEEPNMINHYMTRLKERADQRGIALDYSDPQRLPSDPETFKAQLVFQGRTYVGFGRSKKQAKHQASKSACEYLDSQASGNY